MEPNDLVKVTNRSNILVVLSKPDDIYFRKEMSPGESRMLKYQDILDVAARPGGRELIYNYLLIENPQALREGLNVQEEPEYWLTEDKIQTWMPNCSLEEFEESLRFAPIGVQELIKKYAISLPLNDVSKRNAIKEILGFDVDGAIKNSQLTSEEEKNNMNKAPITRTKRQVSFETPETASDKPKVIRPNK